MANSNYLVVENLLKYTTHYRGMTGEELTRYLLVLLSRNKAVGGAPLVNSRLVDQNGSPLYILYLGSPKYSVDLHRARLIHTFAHAKELLPTLNLTAPPEPLQWCSDPRESIWDSRIGVLGIPNSNVEHICRALVARLPAPVAGYPTEVLYRLVQEALRRGVAHAARDCAYALPIYSRKSDRVEMLLPLHILTKETELPEAAILLNRTPLGYRPVTVLTPQQAYCDVRLFRDPETTWLKGALDRQFELEVQTNAES